MTLNKYTSQEMLLNGPILKIYLPSGKQDVEASYKVLGIDAFIDTGATYSAIDISVVEKLSLFPNNQRSVLVSNGETLCAKVYDIGLLLDLEDLKLVHIAASGMEFKKIFGNDIKVKMILGRDFLSNFMFKYDGINCEIELTHKSKVI